MNTIPFVSLATRGWQSAMPATLLASAIAIGAVTHSEQPHMLPLTITQRDAALTADDISTGLRQQRAAEFRVVLQEALDILKISIDEDEIGPPDLQTWTYAVGSLVPALINSNFPMPLLLPLQGGGIGAEWHDGDINLELRFRRPFEVYCIIEDGRGDLQMYQGPDPSLSKALPALRIMSERTISAAAVKIS